VTTSRDIAEAAARRKAGNKPVRQFFNPKAHLNPSQVQDRRGEPRSSFGQQMGASIRAGDVKRQKEDVAKANNTYNNWGNQAGPKFNSEGRTRVPSLSYNNTKSGGLRGWNDWGSR
jgi:hypothetical protein